MLSMEFSTIIDLPASANWAKGRNGYFRPALVELWFSDGVVHLDISSKRKGESAPLRISLTPENMLALGRFITDSLKEEEDNGRV